MKLGVVLCAVSLMILFYDKSGQYIIKGTKGPLEMYHSEKKKYYLMYQGDVIIEHTLFGGA